jgi:hypothetical protein
MSSSDDGAVNERRLTEERKALVTQYMPMVHGCIKRMNPELRKVLQYDDWLSAGNMALVNAAALVDLTKPKPEIIRYFQRAINNHFQIEAEREIKGGLRDVSRVNMPNKVAVHKLEGEEAEPELDLKELLKGAYSVLTDNERNALDMYSGKAPQLQGTINRNKASVYRQRAFKKCKDYLESLGLSAESLL